MKKSLLLIIAITISIASFSQQKNYGTKTIGQWTFEKFPLHYSVTPAKTLTYKNRKTLKLEGYEEFNETGQTNGLKLTMCSDGIYPNSAIYLYKGEIVYSITYFPNSKTASLITTFNQYGQKDGYLINRTLKSTGGYKETVEKYENGVLVELNGVKQAAFVMNYPDSLLNGKFKFENNKSWIIEGEAENGKLKNIKQTQDGLYFMCEITFLKDSIIVKERNTNSEGYSIEQSKMITNPLITNSKTLCLKYGNYNGYPYLFLPQDFDIRDLKDITKQFYPAPWETKVTYTDSLLDGKFQYREYTYNGGFTYDAVISVTGTAEKGKLTFLRARKIGCDIYTGKKTSDKAIEYQFQDDKIIQKEFVPEVQNEPVATKTLDLLNPVLLTNSSLLGGNYSYDYNNINNILGVPIKRESRLKHNQNGYMYFSPTSFDISNFLSIVQHTPEYPVNTKTEKPLENITTFNKSFLDGDFYIKENMSTISGIAKDGIILSLKIKTDGEMSQNLERPGTNWNNKNINYDIINIELNADANSYSVSYMHSKNNEKVYEEVVPFTINKKITTSENLSGYDNYVFCNTYPDLRSVLCGMQFIKKK